MKWSGLWRLCQQHRRCFSRQTGFYYFSDDTVNTTVFDDMVFMHLPLIGAFFILGCCFMLILMTDVMKNPRLIRPLYQGRLRVGIVLSVLINDERFTHAGRCPSECHQAQQMDIKAHARHVLEIPGQTIKLRPY